MTGSDPHLCVVGMQLVSKNEEISSGVAASIITICTLIRAAWPESDILLSGVLVGGIRGPPGARPDPMLPNRCPITVQNILIPNAECQVAGSVAFWSTCSASFPLLDSGICCPDMSAWHCHGCLKVHSIIGQSRQPFLPLWAHETLQLVAVAQDIMRLLCPVALCL